MTAAVTWFRRNRLAPSYLVVLVLLAILMTVGSQFSEWFLRWRNLSTLFQQMVVLGIVSVGQTVAILTGGIDLSIGSLVGATNVFFAYFLQAHPSLVGAAICIALVGSAAVGAVNGLLIVYLRVHPLIVTLGMSSIVLGFTLLYQMRPGGSVPPLFEEFAYGRLAGVPVPALALLAFYALAGVWLQATQSGRAIYFAGGNIEAARLNGVPVGRVLILVYGFSGLCSGLAAIFLTARTGVGDPFSGSSLTLQSITPVVVGGTILAGGRGSVIGTLLGVFLVSLLNNLLNFMNVSTFYQWVILGLIIIVAVGLHPTKLN
jgi:ribose transport system permease protein